MTTTHTPGPRPVLVVAKVHKRDGDTIRLHVCNDMSHATRLTSRLGVIYRDSPLLTDWQTAIYDSLEAARRGIMRDFGPGWYSKARAAIRTARGEG